MNVVPYDFSGKTIRILTDKDGNPRWVASDVCRVLGLANPTRAITALDSYEKRTLRISKGGPERNILNESGLYHLLTKSQTKAAQKFRRWNFNDVLPAIRKTGSYSINKPELPTTKLGWMKLAVETEEKNEKLIAEQEKNKPKVEYHDAVHKAINVHSFNEAAKLLGWGRNTLMARLRDDKILMRNNTPYQKHLDIGRFEVKERLFEVEGLQRLTHTTHVTGKGMTWLFAVYAPASQMRLFE